MDYRQKFNNLSEDNKEEFIIYMNDFLQQSQQKIPLMSAEKRAEFIAKHGEITDRKLKELAFDCFISWKEIQKKLYEKRKRNGTLDM